MDSKTMLWAAFVGMLNELKSLDREDAFEVIERLKTAHFYGHEIDATMRRLVVGEDD